MIKSGFYEKIPAEKNNYPIRLLYQRPFEAILPHWHENTELLYFTDTDGKTVVHCGTEDFEVFSDTLIVINPNEIHSISIDDKTEYWCIILHPSFFSDMEYPNTVYEHRICSDPKIKEYFNEVFNEHKNALPGSDLKIKGDVYNLAAHLFRNYRNAEISDREYEIRMTRLKRLNDIMQYAEDHYDEKLSASFFAKRCFLSEYYFCHMFKSEMGISFTEYINRLRIQKARLLIENTAESITDISAMTGFDDVNYFSRIFKKYTGVTPSSLRKKRTP